MKRLVFMLKKEVCPTFRVFFPKKKERQKRWLYKVAIQGYPYLAKEIFGLKYSPLVDIYFVPKEHWKLTAASDTHPYGMIYTVTNKEWGRAIFVPTTLPSSFWNHSGIDWRVWLLVMWHEMTHVLFIYHDVVCRKPLWFWEGLATLGEVCCFNHLSRNSTLFKLFKNEVNITEEKLKNRAKMQRFRTLRDCSEVFYKKKLTPESYDYFQRIIQYMDNRLFYAGGERFVGKLFRTLCKNYKEKEFISLDEIYEIVNNSMPTSFDFEGYLRNKWWF